MKLNDGNPGAAPFVIRSAALATCAALLLLVPYSCWAGDDDDDDEQRASDAAALTNMQMMMLMMQDNQAVLDAVRAKMASQRQDPVELITGYQQGGLDRASDAALAASTHSESSGIPRTYFSGINHCIRLVGDSMLVNSCHMTAYVNWSDDGVCHDFSCSDEVAPGGSTTITAVHGRFRFASCPLYDRSVSMTWSREHTSFNCWKFSGN